MSRIPLPQRLAALMVPLACVVLSSGAMRDEEQDPQAIEVTVYDDDPKHPFNRVYAALAVRRGPDGRTYGVDRLDPLLWTNTTHLLVGPSHVTAIAALDALRIDEGERPIARALLQRDLWAVFDWAANPDRDDPDLAAPRAALCTRLAQAIRALALTRDAIERLADNHAVAVDANAFPGSFDADQPQRPFLPGGLLADDGNWVALGRTDHGFDTPARRHTQAFPRSVFSVHVRLPEGRDATLEYLASIDGFAHRTPHPDRRPDRMGDASVTDPNTPQFPAGTQWALVRRAMLLDVDLDPVMSKVVESVQIRAYWEIPAGVHLLHNEPERTQGFVEFTLSRAGLLAGRAGGLVPVTRDDHGFTFVQFMSHGHDPFRTSEHFLQPKTSPIETCRICHRAPGVHSVMSVVRDDGAPGYLVVRPGTAGGVATYAVMMQRRSFGLGYLRGLVGTGR